jgi:hypothetical protein
MAFSLCISAAEKYDGIAENFIGFLQKKEFSSAAESLNPNQKKFDWNSPEGLTIKNKLASDIGKYGEYRFHELISEEKIGNRYVVLTYIIGMNNVPIFMSFTLYKPENSWQAQNYKYNEDLHELIEQSTKNLL